MNLTVEGLKGSMYNLYTYFYTSPHQVLGSNFYIYSFKTLFGRLSYVKERIRIYSCVTLEIKIQSICIQGHPGHMLEPKSSITLRYSTNLKSTQLMYKLVLDRTTFHTINLKMQGVAQIHILVDREAQIGPFRQLGVT